MTLAALRPFLKGVVAAHELNLYQIEDSVQRLCGRRVAPVMIQTLSLFSTFEYIEKLFETLEKECPRAYLPLKCSVLLLPSLITYGVTSKQCSPALCRLHDKITSLSILAVAVSSVALVALGQTAFGGATLALLALGTMNRNGLTPYSLRKMLDDNAYLVANVPLLFLENFSSKLYGVTEMGLNFLNLAKERKLDKRIDTLAPPEKVNVPEDTTIDDLEIDEYHLLDAEHSILECTANESITDIFNRVNWTNRQSEIEEYCSNNPEWQEFARRNPDIAPNKDVLEKGLALLKSGHLRGAELKEYETLNNKLNHILVYLSDADEKKKAELLIRLGISTYGYSGAVVWEVDQIFAEIKEEKEPLKYALQKKRDEIFEGVIDKYFTPIKAYSFLAYPGLSKIERLMHDFFDPKDKHNYYLYVNILAGDFSLTHSHGAKTDQLVVSEAILECAMRWYNRAAVREIKEAYSKEVILGVAREKMTNNANAIAELVNAGVFKLKS